MKNIIKIFKDDINNLRKNFFALVIVIGICFLPALYAWFNIYSNWDPYGNTGALKLAAVSVDKGFTDDEGEFHNQGKSIIDNLKDNKSVNWQFVKTKKQAIEGVNKGEYYAAVVIDEDFSERMYNIFSDKKQKPALLFYENQKKNPVATKISDTVVQTLQTKINETFVEVVMSSIFKSSRDAYDSKVGESGGVDAIIDKLKDTRTDLNKYAKNLDELIATNEQFKTKLIGVQKEILNTQSKKADIDTKINNASKADIDTKINDASKSDINTKIDNASKDAINKGLSDADKKEIEQNLRDAENQINEIKSIYNTEISPELEKSLATLQRQINDMKNLLNQVDKSLTSTNKMLSNLINTLSKTNESLTKTKKAINSLSDRISEAIESVEKASSDKKIETLINELGADPESYGRFFSQPVNVETETIYPVSNYGSAVAPFYSTLAFWVGALILTAIIKVKPDANKYRDCTNIERYFGRYVLFWVLGQLQAIVIVAGNLFLLKIQCIHPWFFMLAASVTATTFTILIYSLVVTWGDVGKAISVVVVVIQIAGSSGTYPIELLPDFFKKVYIFFPFPYAINSIRECLCGMYKLDYWEYLLQLMIFVAVALVIGLLIRIPFEEINHYMEERMEDTEMM